MTEWRLEDEPRLSRRHLLQAFGVAALVTLPKLTNEGVSLNKYPLVLQTVSVGRGIEDDNGIRLLSKNAPELDREEAITITDEGRLLYEPSGEFFTPGRKFIYAHRRNDAESIREAHSQGVNLFDIDANDVHGSVFAEHGIIPQFTLGLGGLAIKFRIPAVIDVNEKELKLGMPESTYEELVALVGSLSTNRYPLAVSTELKRGEFDPGTVVGMLAIHRQHNVPVIMHSTDPSQLEIMGDEIAYLYDTLS